MKKLFYILLFWLPFIITNCKDEPKPIVYLSQSTKDYCRFKASSWWVYKNQFGQIDSNYIYNFQEGLSDTKKSSIIFERIDYTMVSSFYSDTFLFIIKDVTMTNAKVAKIPISGMYYIDSKDTTKVALFDFETIQLWDTLAQYNNFKEIKIFKVSSTMDRFNPIIIYYAKNIGIIRKEMLDGSIWELEKHQVLQ